MPLISRTLVIVEARADSEIARPIIQRHLDFVRAVTPSEHIFALDLSGLLDPDVDFFLARLDDRVVGMAALKKLSGSSVELKSMHVVKEARGCGVGRGLLDHLMALATDRGFEQMLLETGTMGEFAAARALYRAFGFEPCEPFGDYSATTSNTFMPLSLPA